MVKDIVEWVMDCSCMVMQCSMAFILAVVALVGTLMIIVISVVLCVVGIVWDVGSAILYPLLNYRCKRRKVSHIK